MKIELTQEDKKRLISLALSGVLTTGIPTMAFADNTEKAPLVGEVQEEVDYTEYVVQEGDTLGGIAERLFGNAGYWEQIAEYNKEEFPEPNKLFVGDVVKIPNRLTPINCNIIVTKDNEAIYVNPYPEDETYIVKSGDTMCCIVNKFYGRNDLTTVDKLTTYNQNAGRMSDPNKIYVDQELLIPCIEKLDKIVPNDYSKEYAELEWRLNHPECSHKKDSCHIFPFTWNECKPKPPCHP
ncbi:MAG: LysM peptidoglycan-binding domain-containing protein, partial [Bacilli bacterium]|nr:LysM peptidoglycan-binding domain-containing protein [Bacilli bacterium]